MKKIIAAVCCFALLAVASDAATSRTIDAASGDNKVTVVCGESGNVLILMDTSPFVLTRIVLTIGGTAGIKFVGLFTNTAHYSFPVNGDVTVKTTRHNVLKLLGGFMFGSLAVLIFFYVGLSAKKREGPWAYLLIGPLVVLLLAPAAIFNNFFPPNFLTFIPFAIFVLFWIGISLLTKRRPLGPEPKKTAFLID